MLFVPVGQRTLAVNLRKIELAGIAFADPGQVDAGVAAETADLMTAGTADRVKLSLGLDQF